jgi:hypothetical protein
MDYVGKFIRIVLRRADMARTLFRCRTDDEVAHYCWSRPRIRELTRHPDVRLAIERVLSADKHSPDNRLAAAVLVLGDKVAGEG